MKSLIFLLIHTVVIYVLGFTTARLVPDMSDRVKFYQYGYKDGMTHKERLLRYRAEELRQHNTPEA